MTFYPAIKPLAVGTSLLALTVLSGCATSIKASGTSNPPPTQAFSAYGRIDLKPVVFREGASLDAAGLKRIQENLSKNLAPSLESWNQAPANGKTLTVEPVIDEISFKHGASRVIFGPMAGSSGVLMHLNIRDNHGNLIAKPEFFQRADAWAAGFVFGVHDNLMLTRVSALAADYMVANYREAKGGPTGADDKNLK